MITGLLVSVLCFAYLSLCFRFARKTYRKTYAELAGRTGSQVYGTMQMTPGDKRRSALGEAYGMFAFWPVILAFQVIEGLIIGKADPYVTETLERELDMDESQQMANLEEVTLRAGARRPEFMTNADGTTCIEHSSSPCPCGYVTECGIWCGDGSCHNDPGRCSREPEGQS